MPTLPIINQEPMLQINKCYEQNVNVVLDVSRALYRRKYFIYSIFITNRSNQLTFVLYCIYDFVIFIDLKQEVNCI